MTDKEKALMGKCLYWIGFDSGFRNAIRIIDKHRDPKKIIEGIANFTEKVTIPLLKQEIDGERRTKKPDTCCEIGTYECQVPMPLNGRRQDIDLCIADIVAALNAAGITTVASCCGHGKSDGVVSLSDGRELTVKYQKGKKS